MDQIEKSALVKTGMQAGRWEKERTGKRSGGGLTNAFRRYEPHLQGKKGA